MKAKDRKSLYMYTYTYMTYTALYMSTHSKRVVELKCISTVFPKSLYFIFNNLTIKYCFENKTSLE